MIKSLSLVLSLCFLILTACDGGVTVREVDGKLISSTPAEWTTLSGELLAGTLTCTLSGCDAQDCRRSGCEPKRDKSGCTTCTCTGRVCPPCVCEETFTVDTVAVEPVPEPAPEVEDFQAVP